MKNLLTITLIVLTLVSCGEHDKDSEISDMETAGMIVDDMGLGGETAGEVAGEEAGDEAGVDDMEVAPEPIMGGDMMMADMGLAGEDVSGMEMPETKEIQAGDSIGGFESMSSRMMFGCRKIFCFNG